MHPSDAVNRDRLLATFFELVLIDSPTGEEEAIGEELKRQLLQLGCEVRQDAVGNVIGRYAGGGGDPILISCHMDTAGEDTGIRPIMRDGMIYSDGTTILGADGKSGIAVVLESLRVLNRHPGRVSPSLELVMTVGSESGLRGARSMDMNQLRSVWGICLDQGGPIGSFTYTAPGSRNVTFRVRGRRANAGSEPERGISAIQVAAEAMSAIPHGRIDEDTTANMGIVHGGEAANLVADESVVQAMAGSRSQEKLDRQIQLMISAFKAAARRRGAAVEVDIEDVCPAFTLKLEDPPCLQITRAARALNLPPMPQVSGTPTDANLFNRAGIAVAPLSTGFMHQHQRDECIAIQDVVDAARLIVTLVTQDS
jgi:tripeptide aminopeptidase